MLATAADNNLSILKRKPSDLQRYIAWTNQTKAEYGNITNFVCQEKLHWQPLPSSTAETGPLFVYKDPRPFAAREDYKILLNDWPYGFAEGIVHIVVWLKTRIPVQEPEGFLLPESERILRAFVQEKFLNSLKRAGLDAEDRVQWFKNWVSLQSVRGLDHFHVLARDIPPSVIAEWTSNPE